MTSGLPATFVSMTKLLPLSLFGGSEPVVIYLRHSMIVYQSVKKCTVFPDPFLPQISVRGFMNSIFWKFYGE